MLTYDLRHPAAYDLLYAHIRDLCDSGKKKQGIRKQLLNKLKQTLKDEKISVVQLISIEYNEIFCKKCGPDRESCSVQYKRI